MKLFTFTLLSEEKMSLLIITSPLIVRTPVGDLISLTMTVWASICFAWISLADVVLSTITSLVTVASSVKTFLLVILPPITMSLLTFIDFPAGLDWLALADELFWD